MERFIRYSLEHSRDIRIMYMTGTGIRQVTATVLNQEGDVITLKVRRPAGEIRIRTQDVLSCDYAGKDEGLE